MQELSIPWTLAFTITLMFMILRTLIIAGGAFVWLRKSALAERLRIYRMPYAKGQIASEVKALLVIIPFDAAMISLVRSQGLIEFASSAVLFNVVLTLVLLFVANELWFYFTHRLLHHPKLFWMHRQHHCAKVTNPLTSLSFSLLERSTMILGLLGSAALLSLVFPICFVGLVLYALLNYLLNVLAHTNVEFMPEWFTNSLAGRYIITPSYHAMHHARYRGNYGLFTTVLDRLFGTGFADYPQIYRKARAGAGPTEAGARFLPDSVVEN